MTGTTHGFALFDTAIGRCGIAWGGRGLVCVQLPEAGDAATRARVLRRCPDAREASPPPDVRRAIVRIGALLRGEASDLSGVARAVGQALGRNPFPLVVPCHRVIAAGGDIAGNIGGFSAHGGVTTKRRLLSIEKALPNRAPTLFDDIA